MGHPDESHRSGHGGHLEGSRHGPAGDHQGEGSGRHRDAGGGGDQFRY
jgi:hypothetical protein